MIGEKRCQIAKNTLFFLVMLSLQRDILLASQALLHGQAKLVPAFSPRRPTEGERGRGVQEHAKDIRSE